MVSERQGELRAVAGAAETVLASGVALLQPEETVSQAMLFPVKSAC
ncbi:hypothetical protein OG225_42400 (plasmid) [Nocardia sp. NBC_01377]